MKLRAFSAVTAVLPVLSLLSLAGCGGGNGKHPPGPSPTPTATRASTPTPTPAARFIALPFSNDQVNSCVANGISDNGSTVVGQCADENNELEPVRWVNGAIHRLGFPNPLPEPKNAFTYGVSDNGVVVGNQGFRDLVPLGYYYKDGQWTQIRDEAAGTAAIVPWCVSSDGAVIAGNAVAAGSFQEFYFSTEDGELVIIDSTFDCEAPEAVCNSEFRSIDAAGTTVVGYNSISSLDGSIPTQLIPILYMIQSGNPPVRLPVPDGYELGIAQGISRDGSLVVGGAMGPFMPTTAVYWDTNYQPHNIGSLGPDFEFHDTLAWGVSNTAVVVGGSNGQAFIYDRANGMQSFKDYLVALGLGEQVKDWEFQIARAITPDGRYIIGTGTNGAYMQAFFVDVPR